jgi:alpha-tubulin suppressor-like RCC1 family protein
VVKVYYARIAVALAAPAILGACAVVLGLDDHDLYPPVDAAPDAVDAAPTDASPCGDMQTDPNNCGKCGNVCPAGYGCAAGGCGNQVVAVAAGSHGCALLRGGDVWCWGPNTTGQLGVRADGCIACPKPAKVAGVTGAVELASSANASCVRDKAGTVSCWGIDNAGQLGHGADGGDTTCPYGGPCNTKPQAVSIPPAVQIAVGEGFACARLADGSLRCWGDNAFGELGEGAPTDGPHPTPVTVAITSDVVDVAAGHGYASTCATKKDGSLWCWGENVRGILGHTGGGDTSCPVSAPSTPCNGTPSPVANFSSFTSSLVSRVTCAKSTSQDFYCWGYNGLGQVGLGIVDGVDHAIPTLLTSLKAASISPGYNHTCALDADGAAFCWGYNFWGEIGDGTIRGATACDNGALYCAPRPARVANVPKLAGISAGADVTLGLGVDGTVWAWGANPDGRTGHPPGKSDGGPSDDSCFLMVGDAGSGGPCTAHPARVAGLP